MPKIETPEEFAKWMHHLTEFDARGNFDYKATMAIKTAMVAARDAAIRSESATLLKMCGEALEAVESLIKESDGVYGLHLNGSPAPWDELRTGAYFEEWLLPFDKALAALREAGVLE